MKGFIKIEGEFIILKSGRMFIGKLELKPNDEVYLPVKKVRQIIKDSKGGLI